MLRALFAGCVLTTLSIAQDEPPVCLDDRLKIELVAEHPDLVTPTGIDVDHLGRVFVIESNTHFPPDGYQGHPTDRVLILKNTAANPPAKKLTVFADGLTHTMSVAVKPLWVEGLGLMVEGKKENDNKDASNPQPSTINTQLFIATRNEIFILTDTDGDLKADETKRLVHLETKGNYPHNGLAGFAFDALGNMFFGFGENLGADYKIIGSDGTTLSGGGEGGNLYRCKPDGSKLERWATGFWNPHASCFDAFGRLFTVDNDPDSRPPCRLLHIIPGGDYGYRFRNGRKGTHPFTSWNGEIPGTLPMVAGTGEAPSGIVCYENDGFPEDYLGTLLVGSWGDHRIDQFVLEPKGASFTSKAKPIIKGGENFRPVGLAVAPDGSLYFSDWVLKDYKLHGKGRVWRLSAIKSGRQQKTVAAPDEVPSAAQLFKDVDDASIAVRRLAFRQLEARLHQFLNKEERTADESAFFEKYLLWQVNKELTERQRFERLMAEAATVERPEWSTDEEDGFDLELLIPKLGPSHAAYFRLYDPVYGESSNANLIRLSPAWGAWSDRFKKGAAHFQDQTVWMEQARHELLLSTLFNSASEANQADFERLADYLNSADPFMFSALLSATTREDGTVFRAAEDFWTPGGDSNRITDGLRLLTVLAARRHSPQHQSLLRLALADSSLVIRRAAVQWIGEEQLSGFRPRVEELLADPHTTPDLFLACLATLQLLDGKPASEFEKQPPTEYVAAMVKDASRPAALRATALRMLPPSAPELDAALLAELLSSPDESLRTEATRTLAGSQLPEARELLLKAAANSQALIEIRAEAIAGLCRGPHEEPLLQEVEALLLKFTQGEIDIDDAHLSDASQKRSIVSRLQLEALRSLRGRAVEGTKIRKVVETAREAASDDRSVLDAIEVVLNGKSSFDPQPSTIDPQPSGDPLAGRRVFFHHNGPLCAKCHTVQGRGGQVGPDLTVIARTMDREKLLASILEPSKEIAPQFTTWVIETTAGKTHTGFILEDNRTGQIKLGTPTGEVVVLNEADIETREPSKTSVMPEKLHQQMTTQELRDLLAFLETLK